MKRLNMVKAARGWSVGTMWPAPCRKQVPAVSALRGATTTWPTAPVSAVSDHTGTNCIAPPQPYLDSEEGNVGELFHEAPDLVLTSYSVEPRPASHLHLGIETAPSVPSPTDPTASPHAWLIQAAQISLPIYLLAQGIHKPLIPKEIAGHVDIPIVHQDSVFLQSRKSMSTSKAWPYLGELLPWAVCSPPTHTHRGSKKFQVLVIHLHVQALVAAVHLEAAEEAAVGSAAVCAAHSAPILWLAHLHTCHSGASGEMWRAFLTSGEFRYMVGAVELVHGGSIRTLLRATGIRNRFWGSWDSPAAAPQRCPQGQLPHPLLCRWRALAAHCDGPTLTWRQENLIGIRMKEFPRSCVTR